MNLTVSKRILGGFGVITLMVIFIGVLSFFTLEDIGSSVKRVNESSMPVLKSSANLQLEFVKMSKLATLSYYSENKVNLASIKSDYQKEKSLFDSAYNVSYKIGMLEPSMKPYTDNTLKTFKDFDVGVESLFGSKSLAIQNSLDLHEAFNNIEDLADGSSSNVLDFMDESDGLEDNDKVISVAESLEDGYSNIVTLSTELVDSKEMKQSIQIIKDIGSVLSDVNQSLGAIKKELKSDVSKEAFLSIEESHYSLSVYLSGSKSIGSIKKSLLENNVESSKLLASTDVLMAAGLLSINKLSDHANSLSDEIQSDVSSSISSGNIQSIVVVIVSALCAIGIALITVRSILKPLDSVNKMLAIVASGDLTQQLDAESKDEFGELSRNCNLLIESLRDVINGIINGSTQLASASEETTNVTQESAKALDEQQSQIEQAATATTEMGSTSETVLQSADNALKNISLADDKAKSVKALGETSKKTIIELAEDVEKASLVINQLHNDSSSIGKILDVIRGIADQTNLLALNAAIEAARAGEQGRGFAVVADEVRSLASKTQDSTQEIQSMIEKLQSGAEAAVEAMKKGKEQTVSCVKQSEDAAIALNEITDAVNLASESSLIISTAAQEQHDVATEISEKLESIVAIADQTANGANQTLVASLEVAKLSEDLRSSVEEFKV